ncbi:MAG: succinate dehydrogenase cytochrome b subunit [Turneriella sp.]|nr:succinate dehydrogenase cytochrome b subunit [Turneriella sp.]
MLKHSIGKKILIALTGLFLISFLVIHAGINSLIWVNDGGVTFSHAAHFMGTNIVIRTLEIGLVLGFLIHIFGTIALWIQNRRARPQGYAVSRASANSTWYSRSMALLGTLILLFLILHTSHFWIPNRTNQFVTGQELNLFTMMQQIFRNPVIVIVYAAGCFSLFWHLLHGFRSAFQSLGLNHIRYNGLIRFAGTAFAVVIPAAFAMMPVSMYFGWVK